MYKYIEETPRYNFHEDRKEEEEQYYDEHGIPFGDIENYFTVNNKGEFILYNPETKKYTYQFEKDGQTESVEFDKYSDLTNGWNAKIQIKTTTPLDRCAAAYNVFTGTPIVHDYINFKTFHDDFKLLADHHKQVNSFGFGSLQDLSYWTETRLKEDNPTFESPFFPLVYVIPANASQDILNNGSSYTDFEFNVVVMDIMERDLTNQIDVLSDTNQILDDIISQFRLSVTDSLGCFNEKYYLDDVVICSPFIEKYSDLCAGWSGEIGRAHV